MTAGRGKDAALPGRGPERGRRGGLWLDKELAERLCAFCGCDIAAASRVFLPALRLWQWEKLRGGIARAARESLHYREALGKGRAEGLAAEAAASAGLDERGSGGLLSPGALEAAGAAAEKALAALLPQLPFTLPGDLARAPEAFLAVGHSEVSGIISLPTSGTTGPGKRVFCTEGDLAETAAFFRQGMRYLVDPDRAGGRDGDRTDHVALLMSGDRPGSVGDLLARGMRELGVACSVPGFVPPGPAGEAAMLERLRGLAPTCLVGVPAQLLSLARHRDAPAALPDLRAVLLSGDAVTPALRRGIAESLGCAVHVHYGLTETGLGGAVECGERSGCHMREADLLTEIVDGQGRPLGPGQWGEIVITTLTRQAMPLVRYRTGDEGMLSAGQCACGSLLGRVVVRGRMSRRIALPDGSLLRGTELDAALYALPFVRGYSACLHQENGRVPCLALTADYTALAPPDAVSRIERSLALVPGVRIVRRPDELAPNNPAPGNPVPGNAVFDDGRLAVLVRGGKGDAALAGRLRGKQQIERSPLPAPFARGQG